MVFSLAWLVRVKLEERAVHGYSAMSAYLQLTRNAHPIMVRTRCQSEPQPWAGNAVTPSCM